MARTTSIPSRTLPNTTCLPVREEREEDGEKGEKGEKGGLNGGNNVMCISSRTLLNKKYSVIQSEL